MKKLLVLVIALAMTAALAACGSSQPAETTAAPAGGDTTAAPAETTAAPADAASYTYQEDKGNFKIDWTLTLNEDGTYTLMEHNGLVDVDTEHTGASYEQDGDTVKLGAWDDPSADKSDFFLDDGSSTWTLSGDTMTPVIDESMKSIAGTYTYSEPRGDFNIEWKIVLNKGGDFVLEETHGLSGNVTNHTGKEWTDNGDGTFETGEWAPEEREDPHPSEQFSAPNGVTTWKLTGEDGDPIPCEPTEKVEANSIEYGAYFWMDEENDTLYAIMIMGNGNCVIQPRQKDDPEKVIGEQGNFLEYKTKGFRINDDGTFTNFAFDDSVTELPPFITGNGMCTWRIVDPEAKTLELVEQLSN